MAFSKIKKTPARIAITDYLYSIDSPVDIGKIVEFLRSEKLNTNKVTVYRIIEYLYRNGVLERLDFGEGKFRYEVKKGDHHHLICDTCGRIEDVSDNLTKEYENDIKKNKGFLVKKHSLEFFGICSNCQK
jgi:Fur family ferric uptake transcriptional regulator